MSGNRYPHLFSPIQIGTRTYKNRVVNAPRGGIWNEDPEDHHADPEQLADAWVKCRGGVAAYEIGETAVSGSGGRSANEFYDLTDYSEEHTLRYREYAEQIHRHGVLALVELSHMGQAKPENTPGAPAIGPVDCVNEHGVKVTGMTKKQIAQVCEEFADAALFMQRTGYDGVNVHCGHGWLLHQFLSSRCNTRTDEYGGSIENRARFALEVCRAIRGRCGSDFLIEVRISGQENVENGYSLEEISAFAQCVAPVCDLIQVSAGVYQDPMRTKQVSTLYDAHGCNVEAAAEIKRHVSVPVAVVGGINDPADAEQWIAQGKCDLVVLCRQLQADPDFARKAEQGRSDEIRPCIRCMRCFPGPLEEAFEELHGEFPEGCSVNPYLLHFDSIDAPRAGQSKKVTVVGGGAAGMQAAITAAQRGHTVTLVEKKPVLGGILNFARDDRDKYDLKKLADSMAAQVCRLGVTVLLEREPDARLLAGQDAVICAIGSSPLMPPIPGLERCVTGMDAYAPDAPIGGIVVMLGGGLVGCETAIHLARLGRRVTIVEMRDELAPDAYRLHKHKLRDIIAADSRITVMLGTKCLAVTEYGVETDRGAVSGETVVAALGMKANPTGAIRAMADSCGAEYYEIGDCVRARKIYDGIEEGFLTAMSL